MTIRNRSRSNEFTFIPITFAQSHEVPMAAKLVWMSVASRRQAHEPDPSMVVMSAETGLSQSDIHVAEQWLNGLTDAQWQALGLPL
jgi:hypothetical protein